MAYLSKFEKIIPSYELGTEEIIRYMQVELKKATNFLISLIKMAKCDVSETQLNHLSSVIFNLMMSKYREHWYPENSIRGSGYRCIRIDGKMDPLIGQALKICGLRNNILYSDFPVDFSMWIDPREVSYKMGERGGICQLYKQEDCEITLTEEVNMQERFVNDIVTSAQKMVGKNKTPNRSPGLGIAWS